MAKKKSAPGQKTLPFSGSKRTDKRTATISIGITVPDEGISVKVMNGQGYMLGTLSLTTQGIKFIKPKAKIQPERVLSWAVLEKLSEVGL